MVYYFLIVYILVFIISSVQIKSAVMHIYIFLDNSSCNNKMLFAFKCSKILEDKKMKNSKLLKVLCSLNSVCIDLVISFVILTLFCGCGKKEEGVEKTVDFKELIQAEKEDLAKGETTEESVSLSASQSAIEQPAMIIKPVNAQDLYNEGMGYFSNGRFNEAIDAFVKATDMDATMVDAHKKKAIAYGNIGMMTEAIASFKKVIELNPNDSEAYFNLGGFYAKRKYTDDAIMSFEKYVSLNTNNAKAFYNLGCLYGEKKLYDKAIANYQQAVKVNPDYADAYYNLGVTYNDKGMFDESIEVFKKVLSLSPENSEAQYNLAFAYNMKGLYDEAAATCQKLLEGSPGNAQLHLLLGDTYSKLGKTKEAKEEYDAYKKIVFAK